MNLRPSLFAAIGFGALCLTAAAAAFAQPRRAAVVQVQRLWAESTPGRALLSRYGSTEDAKDRGAKDAPVISFDQGILEEVARDSAIFAFLSSPCISPGILRWRQPL